MADPNDPYGQADAYGAPPQDDHRAAIIQHILAGNPTEEDLTAYEQMLGIQAPQLNTTPIPNAPPQGIGSQILQGFSGAENLPQAQPRGFAQGLVSGLTRGLGSAGSRVAAQRAALEAKVATAQTARDQANQKATEEYKNKRGAARQALLGISTSEGVKAAGEARTQTKELAKETRSEVRARETTAAANREWDRRFGIEQTAAANKAKTAVTAKPPTADQLKAKGYFDRAQLAVDTIFPKGGGANSIENRIATLPLNEQYALRGPLPLQSEDMQKYNAAKLDFITAILRRQSGAAINADEYVKEDRKYFVQPGDKLDTIRQKRIQRQHAIKSLLVESGPQTATGNEDQAYQEYLNSTGAQ